MEKKQNFFNLISAQRDYHFVAFKFKTRYSLAQYWKECGKTTMTTAYDDDDINIEHVSFVSDRLYYSGLKEDFSVNADKSSPFNYDLFAIHIKKLNTFIFGFPFQAIARDVINSFIQKHFSFGNFVQVDLKRLVRSESLNAETDNFIAKFSGVTLKLSGDLNISSVNLDGAKPLESAIYTTFFKDQIEENNPLCNVEKCSVKFQVQREEQLVSAANIQLDLFGNFKIYMHSNGNTIFNLPEFFLMLDRLKTTINSTSTSNPLYRSK